MKRFWIPCVVLGAFIAVLAVVSLTGCWHANLQPKWERVTIDCRIDGKPATLEYEVAKDDRGQYGLIRNQPLTITLDGRKLKAESPKLGLMRLPTKEEREAMEAENAPLNP